MTTSIPTVLLFSYGTLQDKEVQIVNFGRELTGREDALPGYILRMGSHYANVEPTSNPEDVVFGTVYEITDQELAAADEYEEDAQYRRLHVLLKSGDRAWVYLKV